MFCLESKWFPLREKYPYLELFWSVFSSIRLIIQSKCRKKQTRIIPNTGTFYAVFYSHLATYYRTLQLWFAIQEQNFTTLFQSKPVYRIRASQQDLYLCCIIMIAFITKEFFSLPDYFVRKGFWFVNDLHA